MLVLYTYIFILYIINVNIVICNKKYSLYIPSAHYYEERKATMDVGTFSKECIGGVEALNSLSKGAFEKVSRLAFGILSDVKKQESTASSRLFSEESIFDGETINGKAAFNGLLTVLLEAAKQDSTIEQVKTVFEELGMSGDRADTLGQGFKQYSQVMRKRLDYSAIGAGKIVGIDWRLDYNATTSEVRTQNRGIYFVSLKVREPVGSTQEIKEIQFQATPQQLEDMLGTIRDATKQVDRVMK